MRLLVKCILQKGRDVAFVMLLGLLTLEPIEQRDQMGFKILDGLTGHLGLEVGLVQGSTELDGFRAHREAEFTELAESHYMVNSC
jgi:hypothetical protein